jgi:hypothetical protein
MIVTLLLSLAAAPVGSTKSEAIELGREIARSGTLATLAPLMMKSDIDEAIAENPELTPGERALLRRIGEAQALALLERLINVEGRAFADNLSTEDMQAIVAFERSPTAQRKRAAMVPVIAATVRELDGVDYAAGVKAEFCQQTGKLCVQERQ